MKKILILNQYFYPDIASTGLYAYEIAIELAKCGNKVIVITSQPCYTKRSKMAPKKEIIKGVTIYRTSIGKSKGREKLVNRIIGYVRYLFGCALKVFYLQNKKEFDVVITFHNPPFIGLVGAIFSRLFDIRFIFIPYDLHPDVLLKTGWQIPTSLVKLWDIVNKFVYNQAMKIIVISNGMKNTLIRRYNIAEKKIYVIPLWAIPELDNLNHDNSVRREIGIKDEELLFLYSGNMGLMHPIEIIINGARELIDWPIKFLFIGDGVKRERIFNICKREQLNNIIMLDYQPKEKFLRILSSADACFVMIGNGLEELAYPSRLFTFLSAGKPIIAISEKYADFVELVKRTGCGFVVKDSDDLVMCIKYIIKNRGVLRDKIYHSKEAYRLFFKKQNAISRYVKVIV